MPLFLELLLIIMKSSHHYNIVTIHRRSKCIAHANRKQRVEL